MEGNVVSWGYARRRKHIPTHSNPFKERWVKVGGVFKTQKKRRPAPWDRIVVVGSDSNLTHHSIPPGALGTLIFAEKHDYGKCFRVRFDDFRGSGINAGDIWVDFSSIKVY